MALRFGLVGLGYHGYGAVLPAFYLPETKGIELVAVCDGRQERLDLVDKPVEKYTSLEDMLASADIDAVYLAAGMDYHCQLAIAALKAGKHVLCEKPMGRNAEECRLMTETAKACGRLLAINFETRYSEKNAILRRWIAEGRLGDIGAIHFNNLWDCHKSFSASKDRRARLLSLAGALDCGIHKLDQARYLLGGNWKAVEAVGAWLGEPCTPPPHIGIIGTLDNGVMVTLNASLAFTANIEPRTFVDNLYIAGTEGVVIVNGDLLGHSAEMELSSRTLSEKRTISENGHTSDIALILTEIAEYVANGMTGPHTFATGEDGYQAQLATDLANTSAENRRIR